MLFNAVGTSTAPAAWNVATNWLDLNNVNNIHIPNAYDDVGIPSGAGTVEISGQNADINSIVTQGGSNLIIASGVELKINSNPPSNPPAGMPVAPIAGQNFFGGSVIDAGRINLNTTNVLTGTNADFVGGTTIGPGDLNGNIVVGPNSNFTFLGGTNTLLAGATFGIGAGNVNILAPVSVMGALEDGTAVMNLEAGGTLGGPGSLNEDSQFNWYGGTLSVTDGVTVHSGTLDTEGANPKFLLTSLTYIGSGSILGGTGPLTFMGSGSILNNIGAQTLVTLPTIGSMGGTGGITNAAGAILNVEPSGTMPTSIGVPFTNEGYLFVLGGAGLALTALPIPGPGGTAIPTIDLDGELGLTGNLYLYSLASSDSGFSMLAQPGWFEIGSAMGSGGPTGTLNIPTGVTDGIGNMEVNSGSLLTGGGTLSNGGDLQLDLGSSTKGLGYYVQSNYGILAEQAMGPGINAILALTGTATLSGTFKLLGYQPKVGDSFTVVTATGGRFDHFDSIPAGMVEVDGPYGAGVTQVNPPPGT